MDGERPTTVKGSDLRFSGVSLPAQDRATQLIFVAGALLGIAGGGLWPGPHRQAPWAGKIDSPCFAAALPPRLLMHPQLRFIYLD